MDDLHVFAPAPLDESEATLIAAWIDAMAEAIAAWVEANWGNGNWDGAPAAIPERIRKGEWRSAPKKDGGGDDDADGQDGPERAVGAVDP